MESDENPSSKPIFSTDNTTPTPPRPIPPQKRQTSNAEKALIFLIVVIFNSPIITAILFLTGWLIEIFREPVVTPEKQTQAINAARDLLGEKYPNQVNNFTITFNNVHKYWSGTGEQLVPDIIYAADAIWNQDSDISISISCREPYDARTIISMNDCHLDGQSSFLELLRNKINNAIKNAAIEKLSASNITYSETSYDYSGAIISIDNTSTDLTTDSQFNLFTSIATSALNEAETDQSKALAATNELSPTTFKCIFKFSDGHTLTITDKQKTYIDQHSVSSVQDIQNYLQSH